MTEKNEDGQRSTCPRCSGGMVPLARAEARVDSCTDCRGVWLAPSTLQRCVATRASDAGELDRVLHQEPPDKGYPAGLKCPGCGWLMMQHSYHGIDLERCPRCEGLFFDHGELEHVIQARKAAVPLAVGVASSSPLVGSELGSAVATEVAVEGGWVVGEIVIGLLAGLFEAIVD